MRRITVAVASVDTTVGAVMSNTEKAIAFGREIGEAGATVGVFQEQLFGGYPAEDLIQMPEFVSEQMTALKKWLKRLPRSTRCMPWALPCMRAACRITRVRYFIMVPFSAS